MERNPRNGSDTMECGCGLLSGELLVSILEPVMYPILEDFECVLYNERVKNFFPLPFFLFYFPFSVWWYHRAVPGQGLCVEL